MHASIPSLHRRLRLSLDPRSHMLLRLQLPPQPLSTLTQEHRLTVLNQKLYRAILLLTLLHLPLQTLRPHDCRRKNHGHVQARHQVIFLSLDNSRQMENEKFKCVLMPGGQLQDRVAHQHDRFGRWSLRGWVLIRIWGVIGILRQGDAVEKEIVNRKGDQGRREFSEVLF